MSSDLSAISVRELSKIYEIYDRPEDRLKQFVRGKINQSLGRPIPKYFREFRALNELSFEIGKGETVGIIGRNGSGKSTLLQMICGTLTPTHGSIETRGRVAALLELGSGFNPEFTGRENVYMNGAIFGMSREEVEARFAQIEAFAEIGEFIDQPVKTYSSGMYARLAFSLAIHVDPDILVVDEALSVGDVFFQSRCLNRLESIRASGCTVLFVSHDLATVQRICQRALLLDKGQAKFFGDAKQACDIYYADHQKKVARPQTDKSQSPDADAESPDDHAGIDQPRTAQLRRDNVTGDGRATIVSLACSPAPSGDTLTLEPGEQLSFVLVADFHDQIRPCSIGIGLRDKTGTLLGGTHSSYSEFSTQGFEQGQRAEIHMEFSASLAPGEYLLVVGIASDSTAGTWVDHNTLWDCLRVVIRGNPRFWGTADMSGRTTAINMKEPEIQ